MEQSFTILQWYVLNLNVFLSITIAQNTPFLLTGPFYKSKQRKGDLFYISHLTPLKCLILRIFMCALLYIEGSGKNWYPSAITILHSYIGLPDVLFCFWCSSSFVLGFKNGVERLEKDLPCLDLASKADRQGRTSAWKFFLTANLIWQFPHIIQAEAMRCTLHAPVPGACTGCSAFPWPWHSHPRKRGRDSQHGRGCLHRLLPLGLPNQEQGHTKQHSPWNSQLGKTPKSTGPGQAKAYRVEQYPCLPG